MRKRPSPTRKKPKAAHKGRSFFTGMALVFAAASGAVKYQRDSTIEKRAAAPLSGDPPNCKNAFADAGSHFNDRAITQMLELLDSPGANTLGAVKTIAAKHAEDRSYNKHQPFSGLMAARIARDLRLLLHYNGPTPKIMTPELEKAIQQFQFQSDLPETGQPDTHTLARLAQESALARLRMTLTVMQVAKQQGLPARDLLVLIDAESGGIPTVSASTSSALGLGQFTAETWLQLMSTHGKDVVSERFAAEARAIIDAKAKGLTLTAEQTINHAQILGLRTQIDTSVQMIARYGMQISGKNFSAAKAYIIYYLGPGGYKTLVKNLDKDISKILKSAAFANPETFYKIVETTDKKGHKTKIRVGRTGQEVLDLVTSRVEIPARIAEADRDLANAAMLLNNPRSTFQIAGLQNVCAPSIVPAEAPTQASLRVPFQVK